jgi:hypothetical protein
MLLLGSALPVLIFAKFTARPRLARRYGGLLLAWTTIYGILLLTTSLSSHDKTVLTKNFCGAYFDCHLSAQIRDVTLTKQIGPFSTTGNYYVVTVVFHNSATRATLGLAQPQAEIIDYYGRAYQRNYQAEQALKQNFLIANPANTPNLDPFLDPLPPQTSCWRQIVFELPNDVVKPRLLISETDPVQGLLELLLIGDEDSFRHAKTYLRVNKLAEVVFEERF